MTSSRIERPHYFDGQTVSANDFVCEQQFQMEMLATHHMSLYTYGIATGLEVSASQTDGSAQQVQVAAGVAIDRLGRQIILTQAAKLSLADIAASATYFITINYHEVYGDYSDASGTTGYKRIVQQPQLKYLRNLDQPDIDILLAVVVVDADKKINALTYQSQNKQRQYVAASVGAVHFIPADSGVNANVDTAKASMPAAGYDLRITAQRENSGASANSYLKFDAPRSQFMGDLSIRGNVSMALNSGTPTATLEVNGNINASNTIASTTQLQAPAVVGSTSVQTPSATSNALNVTGLSIDAAGTVSLFGRRQTWSLSDTHTAVEPIEAGSDGFVYGMISQTAPDSACWGAITAASRTGSSDGPVVSTIAAATTNVPYGVPDDNGSKPAWAPVPASFFMPVRKGEFWNVVLQSGISGFTSPQATIYWIALGNGSASPYTAAVAPVTGE